MVDLASSMAAWLYGIQNTEYSSSSIIQQQVMFAIRLTMQPGT